MLSSKQTNMLMRLKEHTDVQKAPIADLMAVRGTDPFKTLIQTILTAQTKDLVTTQVSKRLFIKVGTTAQDFVNLSPQELESHIATVSYYKTKARHIIRTCQLLISKFEGRVPDTFEELITLPGVGPKTANLILSEVFGKQAITVDIHVHRISNRMGIINTNTRAQSLHALEQTLPRHMWSEYNRMLVTHGQTLCTPVSPHCSRCPIANMCPKKDVHSTR